MYQKKRLKQMLMVKHVALPLPSIRVSDLAKVFSCQKFFIPSDVTTITELQNSMPSSSSVNDN